MGCGLRRYTLDFLRDTGHRPRRSLGQSFLVDCTIAERVAREAAASEVLEIGTGIGALTFYLSKYSDRVIGIEVDEALARYLSENLALGNLDLFVGDILHFTPPRPVESIASSVPYSISSPLIIHLCKSLRFRRAVLVLQEEFAKRLTAAPGSSDYGRLTVIARLCFEIKPLFKVPRGAFLPRPRVDSRVIVVEPRSPSGDIVARVEALTRILFTYRRRTLQAVFRKAFPGVEPPPHLRVKRVYQLSLDDILYIVEYLREKNAYQGVI